MTIPRLARYVCFTSPRSHRLRRAPVCFLVAVGLVFLAFSAAIAAEPATEQKPADKNTSEKKRDDKKTDEKEVEKNKHDAPKIEITLDTSEVPEMAPWAEKAKKICEENYPMICRELASKGYKPPTKATIRFKDSGGVAYTSGTTVTCCKGWFVKHPNDYGAVVHEMAHVVQQYHFRHVPSWLTEGIADYVRWFVYEPVNKRPHVRSSRAKYTDSYQTTAAFLNWIVHTKDKEFVKKMNAACREGRYKPELFEEYAGKPVDELWTEFMAAQKKK